jgi:hypothetical protein
MLPYLGFLLTLISLAGVLTQMNQIQTWLSKATANPAHLVIDTKGVLGPLPQSWQYVAQGGESPDYRFAPALPKLQALKPHYIRLDHIYDFYGVVSRNNQDQLTFDWRQLDEMINDIVAAGALPFISLSYMPPALTDGDVTDPPRRWSEWSLVVQRTIEHISGPSGHNLSDVYYEVWNEPDLFGQWKTYGPKNYLTLYEQAALGAKNAQGVKAFKIGGPAITKLYDNWVVRFIDHIVKHNLRFDFFSWHHYTANVEEYLKDYERYDRLMRRYPDMIFTVEPVITEWGFNSEIDPGYDQDLAAAHTVAVVATLTPRIPKLFAFEFQDGKDPQGQAFWGRWGMLAHQDFDSITKPRYHALLFLNRLGANRVSLTGENLWVKALATIKPENSIQVVITNYDSRSLRHETVPVTFRRINPGAYTLTTEFLGRSPVTQIITVDGNSFTTMLPLYPNAVVYLELAAR